MDEDKQNQPGLMDQEVEATEDNQQGGEAQTLVALEQLIINYLSKIERHEEEYRKQKEMLDNALEQTPEYKEASDKAKEAAKEKTRIKSEILKQPEIGRVNDKVKEHQAEIKEMRQSLSDYLQQYAVMAGTNQFEDNEGQVREIVYIAKVIKRSNKFRT